MHTWHSLTKIKSDVIQKHSEQNHKRYNSIGCRAMPKTPRAFTQKFKTSSSSKFNLIQLSCRPSLCEARKSALIYTTIRIAICITFTHAPSSPWPHLRGKFREIFLKKNFREIFSSCELDSNAYRWRQSTSSLASTPWPQLPGHTNRSLCISWARAKTAAPCPGPPPSCLSSRVAPSNSARSSGRIPGGAFRENRDENNFALVFTDALKLPLASSPADAVPTPANAVPPILPSLSPRVSGPLILSHKRQSPHFRYKVQTPFTRSTHRHPDDTLATQICTHWVQIRSTISICLKTWEYLSGDFAIDRDAQSGKVVFLLWVLLFSDVWILLFSPSSVDFVPSVAVSAASSSVAGPCFHSITLLLRDCKSFAKPSRSTSSLPASQRSRTAHNEVFPASRTTGGEKWEPRRWYSISRSRYSISRTRCQW